MAAAWQAPAAQGPTMQPPPPEPPRIRIEVIDTAPLPGLDVKPPQIPVPVQTADAAAIQASGALDLSSFLNRRFNGVFVNEMQNNPFQPDLNYRGYTASPLLGTPQGLSVYMDGVRLNQPFGDVVSFDLIPRIAIARTALIAGSNPLFGLNTLGGTISIDTKEGWSDPGTTIQTVYGSDQRRAIEFEHGGGRTDGLNWYVAGNLFAEDGWRDDSPSRVGQVFGTIGSHRIGSDTALSLGYVDTSLTGNGLQEQRFLDRDFASVYTKPDETHNRSTMLNFRTRRDISSTLTVSGNAYYRDIRTRTLNGDLNDDSLDQALYQPNAAEQRALAAAGFTGFPTSGENAQNTPFPYWRCIANVLLQDEPGEKCNGLLNRSLTNQHNFGASGQVTMRDWLRPGNAIMVGGGYDGGRSAFEQSTELGYLNPDRSVTGTGAFADGVTGGNEDGEPLDNRVNLDGHVNTLSAFASDVLPLDGRWTVTLSARYNRTWITNSDQLNPGGGEGSLDGDHAFQRLNPAAGFTVDVGHGLSVYANYGEGSRAPTSIELGCADPDQPCKLPNAMAGDPPLQQVVTRTLEGGLRGTRGLLSWHAGAFFANNSNDILFVAAEEQTGFGYFRNFGQTRRQGIELGADLRRSRVSGGLGYTYLSATFQSPEVVDGTGNSTNEEALAGNPGMDGEIEIEPGDHLPLVPRHLFKAYADVQVTRRLGLDLNLIASSGVYARGNENNDHEPDGVFYIGPGSTAPYAVVNLGGHYDLTHWLQAIGQVNNLFDARYHTAAQLQTTGFTSTGNFIARPFPSVDGEYPLLQATFFAPGAPVTAWIGLRARF